MTRIEAQLAAALKWQCPAGITVTPAVSRGQLIVAMAYRDGVPVTTRIARAMRPEVIGLCLDHSARKLMQEVLLMRVAREGNPEISGCVQDFGSFRR